MINIKIIKEENNIFSNILDDVSRNQAKITKASIPIEQQHPTKKNIF